MLAIFKHKNGHNFGFPKLKMANLVFKLLSFLLRTCPYQNHMQMSNGFNPRQRKPESQKSEMWSFGGKFLKCVTNRNDSSM
jgi:hypothetical protein